MANTFPSAGNVGIGTTAPIAPLHIISGSALLALFQGQPSGSERAYIQLTSSNSNYTWQISNQDPSYGNAANGLAFVETTLPQTPAAIRVYFKQGGNVGVGLTNPGSARLAVMNSGGTSVVQFQASGAAAGGTPALSIGYGATYDAVAIKDAGYLQAENPSLSGFPPLLLNPFGGSVQIGFQQPLYYGGGASQYRPPDKDPAGNPISRLYVRQYLSSGNVSGNAMAAYSLYTVAGAPADQSAASYYAFISGGVSGNYGDGSVRALEAQTIRFVPNDPSATTQGVYIGLHSEVAGSAGGLPPLNVGLYMESNDAGTLPVSVRNDAAIYVTGADGWYYGFLYDDGSGNTIFSVDYQGQVSAAQGNVFIDSSGNLSTNGTIAAVSAIGSPPGLFYVDTSGHAYATSFTMTPSSTATKTDIRRLSAAEAVELLDGLDPVRFRYKHLDDCEHLGFILEDLPPALAPTGKGVSMFDLLTVLTKVAKEQRRQIDEQEELNRALREKLDSIKQRMGKTEPGSPATPPA